MTFSFSDRRKAGLGAFAAICLASALASCASNEAGTGASMPAFETVSQSSSFVDQLPEKAREERAYAMQPNAWFEARLDEPQLVLEGQRLHPKLQYEFQERAKARKKSGIDYNKWLFEVWSTPEGRAQLRSAVDVNWTKMAHDVGPLASIRDAKVATAAGDVPVRIYTPEGGGKKPGLVYFHGGGYLMASINAVEPQAKILSKMGDVVVISVDYRLAPEHPFPAAYDDALAVYDWVVANADVLGIDATRLGVAGDSAGGNISAVITEEQIRNGGVVPKAQLLYYPFADINMTRYGSFEVFGNGFGLDKDFIANATTAFLARPDDAGHRWLNLIDTLTFEKHPATIVATAGFDPIRDQGKALADKLRSAGVQVEYKNYDSLNHGFLESSEVIDDAQVACFETARLIGELLRK